jgi:uncharacterized membrane protein
MKSRNSLALSAAIGALAGLRAFTPPAILSQAVRHNLIGVRRSRLRPLRSSVTANVLTSLAIGELIADKLTFMPSRLEVPSLAVRAASGALCGSIVSASGKADRSFRGKILGRNCSSKIATGAILGALGAIGGSFAGFHVRRAVNQLGVPDAAVAMVEDLIAIAGSAAIVSRNSSVLSLATAGLF